MKKVYKSYKNIENFLVNNHLLEGQIELNEGDDTSSIFIPICNIKITNLDPKDMLIRYDTLDTNTGEISNLDYDTFLTYLQGLRNINSASFKRHKIGPIGGVPKIVDYITGTLKMPIRMYRYGFKLNKQQFYLVKILSPNEHTILLLCSPDTDSAWLNRLGNKPYHLNKHNIKNIIMLLHYHLFNLPQGIDLDNKYIHLSQSIHINNLNYDYKNSKIKILTDFGIFNFNFKNTSMYIITPSNSRPRIVFKYKNTSRNDLKISILLSSKYKMNLIDKLTH